MTYMYSNMGTKYQFFENPSSHLDLLTQFIHYDYDLSKMIGYREEVPATLLF